VCGVWCVVCGVWCVLCVVCCVLCVVCCVVCVVCCVLCVVCCVVCVVCCVLCVVWCRHTQTHCAMRPERGTQARDTRAATLAHIRTQTHRQNRTGNRGPCQLMRSAIDLHRVEHGTCARTPCPHTHVHHTAPTQPHPKGKCRHDRHVVSVSPTHASTWGLYLSVQRMPPRGG
jgi:hypothetical protein